MKRLQSNRKADRHYFETKLNVGVIILADKTDLEKIVNGTAQIAVATLTKNGQAPDVRIVLGVYDKTSDQVLFMSSAQAEKVAEIAAHSQAAFATPQFGELGYARIRHAVVEQINPTPEQLDLYNNKYPENAKYAAHSDFFALRFKEAEVTVDGHTTVVKMTD